MSAKLKVVPVN